MRYFLRICRKRREGFAMRYLEDFAVGETLETRSAVTTQESLIGFALEYDPQAMHTDPDPVEPGPVGGLSASGWQTACVVMRLMVDVDLMRGAPMLGMGVDELRWPTPVRVGDTIRAQLEVVSVTPSRSKPDFGVVKMRVTARNQDGATVLTMYPNLWVPRRVG
jgi:acyl dehydratase